MSPNLARAAVVALFLTLGCGRSEPIGTDAALSAPPVEGRRYAVEPVGAFGVRIAAPLETFLAEATVVGGWVSLVPGDLARARGELVVDLASLVTRSFGDASDQTQTQHAKEWLGLGAGVEPAARESHRWARFSIQRVLRVSTPRLADVVPDGGTRSVRFSVEGALRLHGRDATKTVELDVAFEGPADAPTALHVRTAGPFAVSLIEHDVKPRDTLGRFVKGTLEAVGRKLDDKALVTVAFTARPAPDAGP